MQLTRTCRGPSLPTGLLLAGAIGAVVFSGSASGTPPADPDPGRFEKAIQHFEAWDRKNAIPDAPVLFVGSSSIRMWPTQGSFPRLPVINRGFGGAHIHDVNHFAHRIVLPYQPSVIVFYAGDNDIASGKSPQRVLDDYRTFAGLVHDRLPNAPIIFIPIKPSISRWKHWPRMREANAMIDELSSQSRLLSYVDTATPMLGPDGSPRENLFIEDKLHLSPAGYELWTSIVAPAIRKALAASDVSAGASSAAPASIFPRALHKGDTIAFVAPAGPLDRTRMERAKARLEDMGFEVRVPENLYRTRGYLAGDDSVRAAELMAAFQDPTVDALFPGTGGYGTTRILDLLDYEAIRANPKMLIGFSDITALHLAIGKKTGLVTFHSPSPMWGLGSEGNLHEFSARYFWRALQAEQYVPPTGGSAPAGYTYEIPEGVPQIETLAPGVNRGRLTGGNLSLVAALMGTEYEIETDGRVLFLEDVGERPYRVDRYLCELRLAGKFDRLAGVILGQYRDCEPNKDEKSLALHEVFHDYFANLGVPVIMNFPSGHHRCNATLPLGALVEVDADRRRVSVLEDPVTLK